MGDDKNGNASLANDSAGPPQEFVPTAANPLHAYIEALAAAAPRLMGEAPPDLRLLAVSYQIASLEEQLRKQVCRLGLVKAGGRASGGGGGGGQRRLNNQAKLVSKEYLAGLWLHSRFYSGIQTSAAFQLKLRRRRTRRVVSDDVRRSTAILSGIIGKPSIVCGYVDYFNKYW